MGEDGRAVALHVLVEPYAGSGLGQDHIKRGLAPLLWISPGMNTDHTLEEVGQQFSVTRERIRQIEAKALRKLKHPSRSRKLRSFLET